MKLFGDDYVENMIIAFSLSVIISGILGAIIGYTLTVAWNIQW